MPYLYPHTVYYLPAPRITQPGYHPDYPLAYPPPLYAYVADPPEEDEWERKLRVVGGSFDEAIPDLVTSNPGALETRDYEWEGKLHVVCESFDEEIPGPVTSVEEENPGALEWFAELSKAEKSVLELMEGEMVPAVKKEDAAPPNRKMRRRKPTKPRQSGSAAVYILDTKFLPFSVPSQRAKTRTPILLLSLNGRSNATMDDSCIPVPFFLPQIEYIRMRQRTPRIMMTCESFFASS
jgi:hypothetical protein